MKLQDSLFSDLIQQMSQVTILDCPQRQSNLIRAQQMPFAVQPKLSTEFRSIYHSRLKKMSPYFSRLPQISPICEINDQPNEKYIKGILKRLQKNRLRAFEKDFHLKYNNERSIYSEEDELEIEDVTGKLKIKISEKCLVEGKSIKAINLPYGMVVAVRGKFRKSADRFNVEEIYLPELPLQRVIKPCEELQNKTMIIVNEPTIEECESLKQMLTDAICQESQRIVGVVIIGGIRMTSTHLTTIDSILTQLAQAIDVFLIPSSNSDRNFLFPLAPYSKLLFKNCKQQIELCSNPQTLTMSNNLNVLVCCGENVKDMMKNCLLSSFMDGMKMLADCAHVSPTSPFSLKTEPYEEDHLVLNELPHLMICGKAQTLGIERAEVGVKKQVVKLVGIPRGVKVLLDVSTLDVKEVL